MRVLTFEICQFAAFRQEKIVEKYSLVKQLRIKNCLKLFRIREKSKKIYLNNFSTNIRAIDELFIV